MLFKKIAAILSEGCTVTLAVTKAPDGNLSVAASINNPSASDPAKDYIQPFIATGTPEELDAELPDLLTKPLQRSSGLQTSMAEFEAAAQVAAAKSKAAAARKAEEDKEKKQRKAAFDKAFAKAETLEKENKLKEAAATYKTAAALGDGADKAKAEKKARELQTKDQPSLDFFGKSAGDENENEAEPEAEEEGENEGTEE